MKKLFRPQLASNARSSRAEGFQYTRDFDFWHYSDRLLAQHHKVSDLEWDAPDQRPAAIVLAHSSRALSTALRMLDPLDLWRVWSITFKGSKIRRAHDRSPGTPAT